MIDLVEDVEQYKLNGIESYADDNVFVQKSSTLIETWFLWNSYHKLIKLSECGFVPEILSFVDHTETRAHLMTEYLGKSEPVTDEVAFRRNCALLLWTLKKHGIRHGDLTTKNIIVKNNKPMLVDFHQSKFDHEPGADKRSEGDAYWMWESALELSPDTSRHIRKWRAIRPFLNHSSILWDAGCSQGDYCAFASVERNAPYAYGTDKNRDDISIALEKFKDINEDFSVSDLNDTNPRGNDTILLLSVYPYLIHDYGYNRANFILNMLSNDSKQLFFETQLVGDGPGIHKTDDDVYKFLKQFGKVKKLVTIPVFGREPLARSVWRVT